MFSGAVKIEDINDFINPSQECVVPILHSTKVGARESNQDRVSVLSNDAVRPDLIKTKRRRIKRQGISSENTRDAKLEKTEIVDAKTAAVAEPLRQSVATPPLVTSPEPIADTAAAQVSLFDCLACSGCVTTSETVLIQDQSVDTFIDRAKRARFSVVSVSSQSIEYLATHFRLPARLCFRKLAWVLKFHLGVDAVIDTSASDALVQTETLREFLERYNSSRRSQPSDQPSPRRPLKSGNNASRNNNTSPNITVSVDTDRADDESMDEKEVEQNAHTQVQDSHLPESGARLPLLTSHCPGWILYAEKTQPASIVSAVSRIKSSQQILGHLVKTLTVYCHNVKQFVTNYRSSIPLHLTGFRNQCSRFNSNINSDGPNVSSSSPTSTWSNPRSPTESLMGSAATAIPSRSKYISAADVFHASIMPCYDKKLETVRAENKIFEEDPFFCDSEKTGMMRGAHDSKNERDWTTTTTTQDGIQEVDTVLATVEVFYLLEQLGVKNLADVETSDACDDLFLGTYHWPIWNRLPKLPFLISSILKTDLKASQSSSPVDKTPDDSQHSEDFLHPSAKCLCCHTIRPVEWNDASGGFLEYCFREAARVLFGVHLPAGESLKMKNIGNRDIKEISLVIGTETKLRFLLAYGFRNIQNIVKQMAPHRDQRKLALTIQERSLGSSEIERKENRTIVDEKKERIEDMKNRRIDFVEVMACPRGCRYGGGQSSSNISNRTTSDSKSYDAKKPSSVDEITDDCQHIVHSDSIILPPHQHPLIPLMYRYLVYLENHSSKSTSLLSANEVLKLTLGNFKSLTETREQSGVLGISALRW